MTRSIKMLVPPLILVLALVVGAYFVAAQAEQQQAAVQQAYLPTTELAQAEQIGQITQVEFEFPQAILVRQAAVQDIAKITRFDEVAISDKTVLVQVCDADGTQGFEHTVLRKAPTTADVCFSAIYADVYETVQFDGVQFPQAAPISLQPGEIQNVFLHGEVDEAPAFG